jgi:acyl-CoA thioesterase-1
MRRLAPILVAVVLASFAAAQAKAQVVAFGDSSVRGYLLPLEQAWPARLEALLRGRAVDVSVVNQGVNGETSEGMLTRLDSAVPDGTRVVVFMCCGNDNKDERHIVADHAGDVRTIVARLRARKIAVIYTAEKHDAEGAAAARSAGASWCGWAYEGVPPDELERSPAGLHPTPEGHDRIAARVLPCVMRALRKRG